MYGNSTPSKYFESVNINKIAQPFGIGRIVATNYIFEGYIDLDNFNNPNKNKMFRIITDKAVFVYNFKKPTKAIIDNYNIAKTFVESHYVFDKQYPLAMP